MKYVLDEYRMGTNSSGDNTGYRHTHNLIYLSNVSKVSKTVHRKWEKKDNYDESETLGSMKERDPHTTDEVIEEWEFEGRVGSEARHRIERAAKENSIFRLLKDGTDWMYSPSESDPATKDTDNYYVITEFTCTDTQGRGPTLRYDYKVSLTRISMKTEDEGFFIDWSWFYIEHPHPVH